MTPGRLARRVGAEGARAWGRVRDRGFRPGLRVDASGPVLVLSPHLDDAVIDCWSVLTGGAEVAVTTVFAGVPGRPGVLTQWDGLVGATDSGALTRARRDEDRAALALAQRRAIHLDLLPEPYRRLRDEPTLERLDAAVATAVAAPSRVLAPAALGVVHPDHLHVRRYAEALAVAGHAVELYADQPYAIQYGWPHWVTGASAAHPHLDVDSYWAATPHRAAAVTRATARVVRLDEQQRARKLEAMRTYTTQFPMLDRGPIGQLSSPSVHGFEVFWPAPARP